MRLSQKIKPVKQLLVGDEKLPKRFSLKGLIAKISGRILGAFYLNIKF